MSFLTAALASTVRRFPLSLAATGLVCVLLIGLTHDAGLFGWSETEILRIVLLLVIAVFLFLAIRLAAESRNWHRAGEPVLAALACAALVWRVFSLPATHGMAVYAPVALLGAAAVLAVMVAPFLGRERDGEAFWWFNQVTWAGFAFGLLAALILGAGLTMAFVAIDELLGVSVSGEIYADTWILCLGLLWPWQALAVVPNRFGAPREAVPRTLRWLASYVLVPLALCYFAILHAYLLKIAIEWDLPHGGVAWLVGAYGAFGVAVFLIVYPLRDAGPGHVRLFHRHFHHALILPVVLLMLALWVRLGSYGFTEARYALGLVAVWLAGVAVALFRLRAASPVWIPLSLSVLLALASFGPWGAASVSARSQMGQLESLLAASGVLVDGAVEPASTAIDWEANQRIASIIGYLRDTGKSEHMRAWFEAGDVPFGDNATAGEILVAMGLQEVEPWQFEWTFSYFTTPEPTGLDIAGFAVLQDFYLNAQDRHRIVLPGTDQAVEVSFDIADGFLRILAADGSGPVFDLAALAARLYAEGPGTREISEQTLEAAEAGVRVRVIVRRLGGIVIDGAPAIRNAQVIVLLAESDS